MGLTFKLHLKLVNFCHLLYFYPSPSAIIFHLNYSMNVAMDLTELPKWFYENVEWIISPLCSNADNLMVTY